MVSFSEDLEDFNLRLRVEAAPSVPRPSMLRMEEGSGVGCTAPNPSAFASWKI